MILRLILSAFLILHGLVHLLYFGQSRRFFELQPGMTWPQGSWAFSKLLDSGMVSWLASISLALAALGYILGGASLLIRQSWWSPVVVVVAIFSSAIFLLFWNGQLRRLDNQGAVGILINLAILVVVTLLQRQKIVF